MKIDINPVGKPRMTQSDRWKQRPAVMRYRAFCDEMRLKYREELPDKLDLTFHLPMPNSWSQKKKSLLVGSGHTNRPDIDNLCKSVMDALKKNDETVWYLRARKFWAEEGAIEIESL